MRHCLLITLAATLMAACTGSGDRRASVDRMYIIDCGESHVTDLSHWTPGSNTGKAHVFGNHCYLIRHAKGWMMWDSGNADRIAAMPMGLTSPNGIITTVMRQPLAESLREIGIAPLAIHHFAMSHSHGDHSGNAGLFAHATLYMQTPEYDAVFGADAQKFGFVTANFEKLRDANVVKLNGDYDVFGDGSVVIKSAPGHTVGHQVLVVRLPKSGPVMLSGDMVHLTDSWTNRVVPSFNFNVEQSGRTIDAMKEYVRGTGAVLWVNHDKDQHADLPKSPRFVR